MNRRSRKGCIDCKRAKVKCDEVRPTCGTCFRRGYDCQGYPDSQAKEFPKPSSRTSHNCHSRRHSTSKLSKRTSRKGSFSLPRSGDSPHSSGDDSELEADAALKSPRHQSTDIPLLSHEKSKRHSFSAVSRIVDFQSPHSAPLCSRIPTIPPGTIQESDQPGLEVYFNRHPAELVISAEFIDEMNSNVLQVFHEDPAAVAETLSAIGNIYLGEGGLSMVPVLDRKARILARLRARRDLEQMLVMLLGLCALELIDIRSPAADTALPALVANAAIIIKHNADSGNSFSSVAKYFIRALARQDMMISLTSAHPPLIPTSVWLSDDDSCQADRFMGYTGSLMPVLTDLCCLASEIRSPSHQQPNTPHIVDVSWDEGTMMLGLLSPSLNNDVYQRALEIKMRLNSWRPTTAQNITFQSSRNLLLHAHSHKAAALLYLHRLLEPPGSSDSADTTALSLAHEVLMHLSTMTGQLKTALWPVLIAACELKEQGDRGFVTKLFDEIYRQRNTVTALRTREFCVKKVWEARDRGEEWNWMDLALQYPGECLPI